MRDELRSKQSSRQRLRSSVFIVVLVGAGVMALVSFLERFKMSAASLNTTATVQDYSRFSHKTDNHSRQSCDSCHGRADNSVTPRFPGHKACTDCHLAQFVAPTFPMCSICHSSLSGSNPPLHAFPTRFKESFNVKFDHAQHNKGDARPAAGCASCHKASLRRGVAMTIPAGISAHDNCYQCHTPGKTSGGRNISSCATCHSAASYRRTSTNAVAFNASFSHAEHSSKQRLNCADCHSLREGLPQTRQVSSPRTAQHFPPRGGLNCATCHNNKRAFGERDFDDCARCHEGTTFKFRGVR